VSTGDTQQPLRLANPLLGLLLAGRDWKEKKSCASHEERRVAAVLWPLLPACSVKGSKSTAAVQKQRGGVCERVL